MFLYVCLCVFPNALCCLLLSSSFSTWFHVSLRLPLCLSQRTLLFAAFLIFFHVVPCFYTSASVSFPTHSVVCCFLNLFPRGFMFLYVCLCVFPNALCCLLLSSSFSTWFHVSLRLPLCLSQRTLLFVAFFIFFHVVPCFFTSASVSFPTHSVVCCFLNLFPRGSMFLYVCLCVFPNALCCLLLSSSFSTWFHVSLRLPLCLSQRTLLFAAFLIFFHVVPCFYTSASVSFPTHSVVCCFLNLFPRGSMFLYVCLCVFPNALCCLLLS